MSKVRKHWWKKNAEVWWSAGWKIRSHCWKKWGPFSTKTDIAELCVGQLVLSMLDTLLALRPQERWGPAGVWLNLELMMISYSTITIITTRTSNVRDLFLQALWNCFNGYAAAMEWYHRWYTLIGTQTRPQLSRRIHIFWSVKISPSARW